ncbi:cytochrome C and Quinol oxidase polypeptide I family protein [Bordetella holmesii 35009]|nr:cytochrome C and Quinol oxidase polypeptide I family protein [Bordetella holmesii 35009]
MIDQPEHSSLIFGRLTWEAIPYHEPILLATFAAVALGGLVLVGGLTYFGKWNYLWREWFTSIDHKKIGIMYMILGLIMLLRGFADAIMMRLQQAIAFGDSAGYLPPHHYDQIFTAHGVIMIFFVAMPLVTGLMNYIVPLQIGVRDVAFPFLNNFSFWMTAGGAVLVMMSLFVGEFARTGWLAYPRCRASPRARMWGGLLHMGTSDSGRRDTSVGGQPAGDHRQNARPRYADDAHAHLHLDGAVHQCADRGRLPGSDGRSGHAHHGPVCRHQLLHDGTWRQRHDVREPDLNLGTPRGLYPHSSGVRYFLGGGRDLLP